VDPVDPDPEHCRIRLFNSMLIQIRIRILWAKPMRIHADPDPGQIFKSEKVNCIQALGKIIWDVHPGFRIRIFSHPDSRDMIRIIIPNTDPDPGQPNECGSESITLYVGTFLFPFENSKQAGLYLIIILIKRGTLVTVLYVLVLVRTLFQ
jgi:hypothetical protein